jgi:hypothetical protein
MPRSDDEDKWRSNQRQFEWARLDRMRAQVSPTARSHFVE